MILTLIPWSLICTQVRIGNAEIQWDLISSQMLSLGWRGNFYFSWIRFRVMEGTRFALALYPPRIKGNTHFGCCHLFFLSLFFYLAPLHLLLVGCRFITCYCFVANLLAHLFFHLPIVVHLLSPLVAIVLMFATTTLPLDFTTYCCFVVCFHHLLLLLW